MSLFRRAGALVARIFKSTADPAAEANAVQLYAKDDGGGIIKPYARYSNGTVVELGATPPVPPVTLVTLVVWTAAKSWTTVYAEIVALGGFCIVLVEPSGANRNITTGAYNINGVRFIGMPQLNTANNGYGMVKVDVDAAVTFTQDGTTLFAVISSQDVFWYFQSAVQPVTTNKIRIRLDGGKMHADAGAVFTGITEARIYLTSGAHLEGYSGGGSDELILLADAATCVIEVYGARLMKNVISTPGTAFSATVTAFIDPASVVQTGASTWFRVANTTPTYNDFWASTISGDATALSMLSPSAALHRPYILDNGAWSNAASLTIRQLYTAAQDVQPSALTWGANIAVNAALSNTFTVTLTGVTAQLDNPSNLVNGQTLIFRVLQDGTGGRALTFGTAYDFGTEGAPTISTSTLNVLDIITAISDGTNLFCTTLRGFTP